MDDLLDNAPCGFIQFRDDGSIIEANRTLTQLLGYAYGELNGRNIETILTIASRIFYNTHFFPLIRLQSRADEIFLSLKGREGADVPVLTNALRREEAGTFVNICVFIAVFQRKKFEEEILNARRTAEDALRKNDHLISVTKDLEERTRDLDQQNRKLLAINENLLQFSRIISHDLQEPIHKIQIFTNILTKDSAETLSPKSKNAAEKIHAAALRLRELTIGLDRFIRLDEQYVHSKVDLNEVLVAARERAAADRNFSDFDLSHENLPTIDGYPAQLELLFYHLIDNAIQFRRIDHRLGISVTTANVQENIYKSMADKYKYTDHVQILFADNGTGFDNQYSDYVFQLVKKLDSGSAGLGIGLSIIRKVVENHSGSISATSEEGKGTSFRITLPLLLD